MKWKVKPYVALVFSLTLFTGCAYNPLIPNNHTTGSPVGAIVGASVGAGGVALLGGSKPYMGLAGIAGGVIGYYVTTLRYDSGGIIQAGGTVYKIGDFVGIYIPSDNLFEPNTDRFLPQAKPILDSAAAIIMRYPKSNVLISGNTSGFYRARWEQSISERRAEKIAAFLWNAEINNTYNPGRRLDYVGHGDFFPIAKDITNRGIRDNSRIQITLYPSDCDLHLSKRQVTAFNIADLRADERIARAPVCSTMNAKGECLQGAG